MFRHTSTWAAAGGLLLLAIYAFDVGHGFVKDDFVWILAIFFKTPVEFVQLLLGDGHSSGSEDNSSQSSTAKANLSAVESFCSSGIVSLIMPTRLPYSGPSRNWWKASRSGDSIVFPPIQGRMERFKKPLPAKCRIERKILVDIL